MTPSPHSLGTGGGSNSSSSSLSLPEQPQQTIGTITGDKELLWSRLREADNLQGLLKLVEDSGFHPVVLPRRTLLREGAPEPDFGAILGQLGVFGAILDCKTATETMHREMTSRELNLVQLGLTKNSINLLLRHLQTARNLGRAACLVIDDCAPPDTNAASVYEPLLESRHLMASGLPAVIFGSRCAGTVTRIGESDRLPDGDGQPADADCRPLTKCCGFTNMMLVAYEAATHATA